MDPAMRNLLSDVSLAFAVGLKEASCLRENDWLIAKKHDL
jgi:hypothetical protein